MPREYCQRCHKPAESLTFYKNQLLICGACEIEVTMGGQPLVVQTDRVGVTKDGNKGEEKEEKKDG